MYSIDAAHTPGFGCYINHSVNPNVKPVKKRLAPGKENVHILFTSIMKIPAGSEILFDYNVCNVKSVIVVTKYFITNCRTSDQKSGPALHFYLLIIYSSKMPLSQTVLNSLLAAQMPMS